MQPSTKAACEPLPVRHVAEVEPQPVSQRWLIDSLWLAQGCGILGGAPKVCKTFLAAELALAVASGMKALGRYPVQQAGPVLFYGAEDSLTSLRERFLGLSQARRLELSRLPIYLLDVPVLRLDRAADLSRLKSALAKLKPRLLVLDPFVRMAAIDENSAADVSAVLGSLREIQRAFDLAVMLVHHARKSPAASPAQALRGSGDFAAWSDTNLYLTRRTNKLTLSLEHRSAPSPEPIDLRLVTEPSAHLCLLDDDTSHDDRQLTLDSLQSEIVRHLTVSRRPMSTVELRNLLSKRKQDVVAALQDLSQYNRVKRTQTGWVLPT